MALFSFISPLDAPYDLVESGWGSDRSYRGAGALHEGIDFRAPVGTPLRAIDDGLVRSAFLASDGNAGYMMEIVHDGGVVSRYLHMNSFAVPTGVRVSQGQIIGTSGETGSAKGDPQLHFDLRVGVTGLDAYKALYGTPGPSGFPSHSPEWAVPAEPVVPARYSPAVVAASKALGVKFWSGIGFTDIIVGGAIVWAGWKLGKYYGWI